MCLVLVSMLCAELLYAHAVVAPQVPGCQLQPSCCVFAKAALKVALVLKVLIVACRITQESSTFQIARFQAHMLCFCFKVCIFLSPVEGAVLSFQGCNKPTTHVMASDGQSVWLSCVIDRFRM